MEDKVKKNISILELIPIIRETMRLRGWKKDVRLSETTEVATGVVSRFLNHGEISGENICKILIKLRLIKNSEEDNFMCGWSPEEIDYCEKLKKVLENKEDSEIIKKMIDAYADKYKIKKTRKKGTLKQMGT